MELSWVLVLFGQTTVEIVFEMKYLAICTDLDETLLDDDRKISTVTKNTFKKLDPELKIILASARMPRAIRSFQQELNIETAPIICYNGSYVIRTSEDGTVHELFSKYIDTWLCEIFVNYIKNTDLHLGLFSNDNWYVPEMDKWTKTEIKNTDVIPEIMSHDDVINLWKKTGHPGAHKIMCKGEKKGVKCLYDFFAKNYSAELVLYLSEPEHLEIAPSETSKANALQLILQKEYNFGINRVIAFGDNENDLDLLKTAGLGIAVANAKSTLKAVADEITLQNTEDGVVVALKNHVFL